MVYHMIYHDLTYDLPYDLPYDFLIFPVLKTMVLQPIHPPDRPAAAASSPLDFNKCA